MKPRFPLILTATALALTQISALSAPAQAQRGGARAIVKTAPANPVVEKALLQALTDPEGEYAAYASYAAIVEKFGQVQPYASILRAEERHIAVLKRHLEIRGIAVPENSFLGAIAAPANLKEAAEAAVIAEELNATMYGLLLEQVKDQPDLVRVFTHLQFASQEHHLPALAAAVENGGQLQGDEFECGMTCGLGSQQGRGAPPAWAGGVGRAGLGQGACGAACVGPQATPADGAKVRAHRGYRGGAVVPQGQ